MANFCTNCGSKVDDDDSFCTNCGTKIYKSDKKPKGIFGQLKRGVQIARDDEIKKARKELKKIVGGITFNDSFENELKRNGLATNEGIRVRSTVNAEIYSGKIKSDDVRNRVDELLLEYKSELEEEIEEFKLIDEFFESDEIKSKISKGKISQQQVFSIKSNLKNKVRFGKTKVNEEEIKKELNTELEKEIINKNRVDYIEDIIKDSCPNIKLTNFEKEYINIGELSGTIDEMKNKLNSIAKKIINRYEKIDEYDFAGIIIEDRGFIRRGPFSPDQVAKAPNDKSFAFLKVYNNNIFIVKTNMGYNELDSDKFNIKGEMTIYFSDMNALNYSNEKIILNLNSANFTLQDYYKGLVKSDEYETFIEDFYNILNNAWNQFKNNENGNDGSANKNDVSTADELMKYAELYEKGILSEDEFNAIKKKLLQL